jgi:hypothetical protein
MVAGTRRALPVWVAALIVWGAVMAGGVIWLGKYASTPGAPSEPPPSWPEGSAITRVPGLATVIMLAHPKCPCTRASVAELAQLMERARGYASAHVLFLRPEGVEQDWEKTDLWRSIAAIPGVSASTDEDGVEAARFRASTSGETIVYDASGRLVFHGGITIARGHEGESPGLRRIQSLLLAGAAERGESPVFGCPLTMGPLRDSTVSER